MARGPEPMTVEEFAGLRAAMDEQGDELREAVAEDLGADPGDYRVAGEPVPDGGDE